QRVAQQLHALLVTRFEGGVFGATWEQFARGLPPAPAAPTPWWIERRDELLEIAEERGAAYVYERRSIEKARDELKSLKAVGEIYYAMKANPHPEVLRTVHAKGANFESVSPVEI